MQWPKDKQSSTNHQTKYLPSKTLFNSQYVKLNTDQADISICELCLLYEEFEDTKGESESVNRRRTDNIMAKIKRTNNDLQNIHKTKIE